jgi:hypothetical protein
MGLTLGCARCHDHKFDPISTEDYYALAGILKSSRFMSDMKKPRMWFEHSLASKADLARKAAHEKRVAERKAAIQQRVDEGAAQARAALPAGGALPKNVESVFPDALKAELKRLRDELAQLEKDAPAMPAAMGVAEGTVADLPIHVRGSFLDLGPVVPRRFPIVLAGDRQPPFDPKESGRLRLARWLVSPEHPLTARVIVNRVWRWHFGAGLVPTPDNFGLRGEPPSHPELLDWLAATFVEGVRCSGVGCSDPSRPIRTLNRPEGAQHPTPHRHPWRLKPLHRLILLSNTYRMSGRWDARAARADPENRLRWRWTPQRLEAEAIRDALLAVSGQLDRTMGGTLLTMKNREYFFDHTSKDNTRYESRRRSIYLPVVRNHLYDGFQLFDFGDATVPEGSRPTTTVAPQALFMLNSDLVMDAANALASLTLKEGGAEDRSRLSYLYRRIFARAPSAAESARALTLLRRFAAATGRPPGSGATEASAQGGEGPLAGSPTHHSPGGPWAYYAHILLASNEFVFVH